MSVVDRRPSSPPSQFTLFPLPSRKDNTSDHGSPTGEVISIVEIDRYIMEEADLITATRQYRAKLLREATQCPGHNNASSVSRLVADHVLSYLHRNDRSSTKANDGSSFVVHLCEACGALLHPGFSGNTIRTRRCTNNSLSPSQRKTLRRNLQRKRKRQAAAQAQAAKQQQSYQQPKSSSTNPQIMVVPTTQMILQEDPTIPFRLERHHLVLACGTCNHKIRLQGLKRSNPRPPGQKSAVTASKPPNKVDSTGDDLGFVPLPKVDNNGSNKPPTNLLLQQGAKKKKKKKPKQPANKLMSFLSSLNDN